MAPRNPVLAVDGHAGNVAGEEMRRLIANLTDGAFGVVDGLAVTAQATATRSVDVAVGGVLIPLTEPGLAGTGPVWGYNDAVYNVPFAVGGTNPRIDRVVAQYFSNTKLWDIIPIQGVEHATNPVPPATPANAVFLRDVRIDPSPNDTVVAGDITGTPTTARMEGAYAARIVPAFRSTSSTTFVDWPPTDTLTKTIVKHRASSLLVVHIGSSFYFTGSAARLDLGVRINGVDFEVTRQFTNELNSYRLATGFAELSGIPAGTHVVTMRAKVTAGTANVNADANVSMSILEV